MAEPYAAKDRDVSLSSPSVAQRAAGRPWIIGLPGAVLLALGAMACGAEPGETDVRVAPVLGAEPQIFGGARDDDRAAIAGVVALRVGAEGTYELCTGALIAPNVVLTARHCVTKNLTTSVSCDENGQSANGKHVATTEEPGHIAVFVGASPSFAQQPSSFARAVVAPSKDVLCDTDIAVVVLERAITSVEPLPVRLEAATYPGETVRSVGYGQNDKAMPIGTRFRREGVEVLAMGKAVSPSKTPLGLHEFEVGKSICQGDSGGPAISEQTGAVIGVVSRGGGCDEDHGHIYTTTVGFNEMWNEAFQLAGASPTVETPSDVPRIKKSGAGNAAPEAFDRSAANGGCSSSGTTSSGGVFAVVLAAALVLARRRRA